jgi:hypothetical protein
MVAIRPVVTLVVSPALAPTWKTTGAAEKTALPENLVRAPMLVISVASA